ncbi:MAG: hypothetical protein JSV56_06345 [Methanomassiliicoccales archaeon]|nr:MAG: hypothetical protein JSV56_06345 [Methanomassiliicoccales archaeon]
MSRKAKLGIVSIFFTWIFVCMVFVGVVEAQAVKERLDVEVASSETEIIESTYTDRYRNRRFRIENGENEIIATVWGSNGDENWEYWTSETIAPEKTDSIVLGVNHFWYVKLTGRTTGLPTETSIVDASLIYHLPD